MKFIRPMRPRLAAIALTVCLLLPWGAAVASGDMTEDQSVQFLAALQDAVKSGQPKAVAALVIFPLRVYHGRHATRIKDAQAFLHDYPHIFTADVTRAVLAQKPGELFHNWQGSMIGNGQVWFAGVCTDAACNHQRIGITAVNN
jgi:hypothetical protein